jgi:putative CRISPR-associated protein (TIGR02619 family)
MKNFILSTCGTSLLTNEAGKDEKFLVYNYANARSPEEVPEFDRNRLQSLIDNIDQKMCDAGLQTAAKMSAEINGIVQFYNGQFPNSPDYHYLLSTDTWLGEETAHLVEKWLRAQSNKISVFVNRHSDLQTERVIEFQLSLSDLIKDLCKELPRYKEDGYHIVFNLTGGFKSVQGFLQTIAELYADETVYIFERSSTLLRIPRLPIRLDALGMVKKNLTEFRNLSMGIQPLDIKGIPETFLLTLEGQTCLSPWGSLVWEESRPVFYSEVLLETPRPEKIRYADSFIRTAETLPADRLKIVNHRIDQLNRYLEDRTRNNPGSLDFKSLKTLAMAPSTHEMDAWADKDAKRIFGHFEGNLFILDKLEKGLH